MLDPDHVVEGNLIGVDAGGASAVPNGTAPGAEPVAGAVLSGSRILLGGDPIDASNVVSGNLGPGVLVVDRTAFPADIAIAGNRIGTSEDLAVAVPNTGPGILVTGSAGAGPLIGGPMLGNTIDGNLGSGIVVRSDSPIAGVRIDDNVVGRDLGNGGSGIELVLGAALLEGVAVTGTTIRRNTEYGIRVVGATAGHLLTALSVTDNGLCAIQLEGGANGEITPPTVESYDGRVASGSVVAAGLDRVEVYLDPDTEAENFLGEATVDGATWTFGQPEVMLQPGRIAALAIYTDGSTTELTPACADGCSNNADGLCDDFNDCSIGMCDPVLGCSFSPAPDGSFCEDDNVCTKGQECQGGVCVGLILVECAPGGCRGAGDCDPVEGCPRANCDDLNACTDDFCDTADTGLYPCRNVYFGDGEPCEKDGDACTIDVCTDEECLREEKIDCDDGDDCTADVCDPADGTCSHPLRPEGWPCRHDGDKCNGPGTCDASGACNDDGSPPCDFGYPDMCGISFTCDPEVGICHPAPTCGDGRCSDYEWPKGCEGQCAVQVSDCPIDDEDGDGIPDMFEIPIAQGGLGIDEQCDGIVANNWDVAAEFLLDPNRPSVLLEIDYMVGANHSHEPLGDSDPDDGIEDAVVDQLTEAFAHSGHQIIIDVDDPLPHFRVLRFSGQPSDPDCVDWIDFDVLKHADSVVDKNGVTHFLDPFELRRKPLFHYAIMGHEEQFCGSRRSGRAEGGGPANDLMVTLGSANDNVGSRKWQTGALLHELGHTLELRHGGDEGVNRKPNYQSTMSYRWNLAGLPERIGTGSRHDFSHEEMPALDESMLDEMLGFQSSLLDIEFDTRWHCPPDSLYGVHPPSGVAPGEVADFDCDDVDDLLPVEVNLNRASSPEGQVLTGHNDWDNLDHHFHCTRGYRDGVTLPDRQDTGGELDLETAARERILYPSVPVGVIPEPPCPFVWLPTEEPVRFRFSMLSTAELDARTIIPSSVVVARANPVAAAVHDADGDGRDDLQVTFFSGDMTVPPGAELLTVYAELPGFQELHGALPVVLVDERDDDDLEECDPDGEDEDDEEEDEDEDEDENDD